MMPLAKSLRSLPVLAVFPLLAGCLFGGGDAPTTEVQEEKVREKAPEVVQLEEDPEVYSYSSIGKRDPFRSFIQKEVVVNHVLHVLGRVHVDAQSARGERGVQDHRRRRRRSARGRRRGVRHHPLRCRGCVRRRALGHAGSLAPRLLNSLGRAILMWCPLLRLPLCNGGVLSENGSPC